MAATTSTTKYAITGIRVPEGGPVPTRQEITAWWNKTDNEFQKSLFILALQKLQRIKPSETLSYFQIAGIHCYPIAPWDGEPKGPEPGVRDEFGGYCTHNMTTFPLWHRPYMALFEQVLFEVMQREIVSKMEDGMLRQQWSQAADTFRLPYWDWARSPSRLPVVCTLEQVEIVMPGELHGKKTSVDNPLLKFTNRNDSGTPVAMGDRSMPDWLRVKDNPNNGDPLPWSKCSGTSRYGILKSKPETEWAPGVTDNAKVDTALENAQPKSATSLTDAVGRMLTIGYLPIYHLFASTKYHDPSKGVGYSNKNFLSLEEIHNMVHDVTGGGSFTDGLGHMADVPVAAFDPVFWLHHCNIDRLFGFWRKLNPNSGYTRGPDNDPLFTDPLPPFHYGPKPAENHTSETNWDHLRYHYEYDDLALFKDKPIQEFINYVKTIYPTSSSTVKANLPMSKLVYGKPGEPETSEEPKPRYYDDYLINVIYDRYALDGLAYSIFFFLGEPSGPPSTYHDSPSYLGKIYTFSAPLLSDGVTACDNCAQQKKGNVKSTAQIPLTRALIEIIQDALNDILPTNTAWDRNTIEEILQRTLTVKFVDITGQERSPTEFPKTTYAVLRGTASIEEKEGDFPTFGGYKILEQVTKHELLGYGARFDARVPESSELDQLIHDDDGDDD